MLQVHPLSAFDDNYIWLLDEGNGRAAVVDPGDADPVLSHLRRSNLQLSAILITHKHFDHVGGIEQLKQAYPGAIVYGPAAEAINGLDIVLHGGQVVDIPGMAFGPEVIDVPGHTEGHIAYLGEGNLFCGDTLFACGCGRVFSGTMNQLHQSLGTIAALPPATQVYCAHEYTLDNIGFARWVEPGNTALLERERQVSELRDRGMPSVPSTLQLELETNPFMRTRQDGVIEAAERHAGQPLPGSAAVFSELRLWKDQEYD